VRLGCSTREDRSEAHGRLRWDDGGQPHTLRTVRGDFGGGGGEARPEVVPESVRAIDEAPSNAGIAEGRGGALADRGLGRLAGESWRADAEEMAHRRRQGSDRAFGGVVLHCAPSTRRWYRSTANPRRTSFLPPGQ
jgi:hypothetical protein